MDSSKLVCPHYLPRACYLHGGCGVKMETMIIALVTIRLDFNKIREICTGTRFELRTAWKLLSYVEIQKS